MPTSQEILAGLAGTANDYWLVAAGWHAIFLILIFLLFSGWRPRKMMAGMILVLPLLSVSVFAFLASNPFNAAVFLLLSAVLLFIWGRFPAETVDLSGSYFLGAGLLMIIYAWVYPHFLAEGLTMKYLYAAPMGLIPCPTLSLVIGFTLLFQGFGSKKWVITLVVAGLFYALFGIIRLGVFLDFGLLAGSLFLGLIWLGMKREAGKVRT
jgi:hypothetical protein